MSKFLQKLLVETYILLDPGLFGLKNNQEKDKNYNSQNRRIENSTNSNGPNNKPQDVYSLEYVLEKQEETNAVPVLGLSAEQVQKLRATKEYLNALNGLDDKKIEPSGDFLEQMNKYSSSADVYRTQQKLTKVLNSQLNNHESISNSNRDKLNAINLAIHDFEATQEMRNKDSTITNTSLFNPQDIHLPNRVGPTKFVNYKNDK